MTDTPLWTPRAERADASHLAAFTRLVRAKSGQPLPDYVSLWRLSVDAPALFWPAVWDYTGLIGDRRGPALAGSGRFLETRFFPGATLNYAENLLAAPDGRLAIRFLQETGDETTLTRAGLSALVSRLQQAMREAGVKTGDRIAGFVANQPETIAAMLATASLGAVWTSCSTDFGVDGCVERFGQTAPKLLFCSDSVVYGGKRIELAARAAEIAARLPSLARVIVLPCAGDATEAAARIEGALPLDAFIAPFAAAAPTFTRVPFDHPLFILYSSGTTGAPKCIVHGHGGTLLQHLKEHQLHADMHAGDTLLYYSTCGWMMWNWLASALASGVTLMCYEGSPFAEDGRRLWRWAEQAGCTHFGTSARYLDALAQSGLAPCEHWPLARLRVLLSTGSPLSAERFQWVYRHIKRELNLASISGGTDIVSCFALGNPTLPVWAGELQCAGLGMAIDVVDDAGHSVSEAKGELVCRRPFPSMPVGFWNDPGQARYRKAYFSRFAGLWAHGDYAEQTRHGGLVIHGRSDAVLNPGGVRIGTAEIYRQLEGISEVLESIAIGQKWHGDERVVLFVRLRAGAKLDDPLVHRIRTQIRDGASPRHVPARIVAVDDLPRTLSGKLVELAVRNVVHGEAVANVGALANPEALALFRDLPELSI
ncbi:acetoacetate--CoA ligase [Crenobacter caeni]|uniref:Acetoacetate--CoA ligase n=1 Tax=Crenobacter caeni TaxID=2705474 RepID=A0A6B2KRN9_9NEIS|nr:acetoacetate--CoA ligase [Crenobacter caeni]NDV12912.1 acetoacetate--CoA ligase [Crenobacter caeni]